LENILRSSLRRALVNRYGIPNKKRFQGLFAEQFYYGHREVLLKYGGLESDRVFEAVISHGDAYPFEENRIPKEHDLYGNPLLQLEWRSDAELVAKELGVLNVVSIGAVGMYELLNQGLTKYQLESNIMSFCNTFSWPESTNAQLDVLKEHSSVLFFPEHSWVGDVLLHNVSNNSPLLELDPKTVTVCLGWGDFTSPEVRRAYETFGWRLECVGISNNPIPMSPLGGRITFLSELFNLIDSHDIVVADQITTGLFYSALLNKKCGILSAQHQPVLEFSYWRNNSDVSAFREKSRLQFGWLWGEIEDFSKILNDVETLLGIKSIKSPDFFRDDVATFSLNDWIY
jgi:hypothetical protein